MLREWIRNGLRGWERARLWPRPVLSAADGDVWIGRAMRGPSPCAIAKLGSVELAAIRTACTKRDGDGICRSWSRRGRELHLNAGVFPATPEIFTRACDLIASTLGQLDLIGVWHNRGETAILREMAPKAILCPIRSLEPYYHNSPWSTALAGRRVVVVSPFAPSIERQFTRRSEVWAHHPDVLPACTLATVRAPLSAALVPSTFPDWFAALDDLSGRMVASRAEIAIIGAGAWSIPLAARAKQAGMHAIHLGGATQLLFGIRGRRWDQHADISRLFTPAWSRPLPEEHPPDAARIEGGCYW